MVEEEEAPVDGAEICLRLLLIDPVGQAPLGIFHIHFICCKVMKTLVSLHAICLVLKVKS